jgi:uncharacterized protein (DUF2336 family)
VSFAKFKESVYGANEHRIVESGPAEGAGKEARFERPATQPDAIAKPLMMTEDGPADESGDDPQKLESLEGDIPEGSVELRNGVAIKALMMRLADLLFLPSGLIAPQERSLSDDLISRLFVKASRGDKFQLVERMLQHSEPPQALIRTMIHSEDEIALPILRSPLKLKQADLISVVTTSGPVYQKCVAQREELHSAVCDAIIQCSDVTTIRVLLRNATTVISRTGFVRLAEKSLTDPEVLEPLIERTDFPPDLAHLVFWWSPSKLRLKIIERFASPRQSIFEIVSEDLVADFVDMIPEISNAYRMVRKAQKMDRSQIDRALDELETGDANNALDTLSDGAHLKAETIAQIFDDNGGEAIGVFCKAIGFGRERFVRLRSILIERRGGTFDVREAINDNVSYVHDTLSTDKADLILRYWDRATREIEI